MNWSQGGGPSGHSAAEARLNWRAAILLGLVTSTFSTLVAQLLAARIGRDAVVDWMIVAAIPGRDGVLQVDPGWGTILGGILFHQWADFSWAVVFFGLLGRLTARLRPGAILLLGLPWAVFTSASEWLFLMPILPFWQPVFTLNQAYWIGLLVRLTSAALYPLFPWIRDRLAGWVPAQRHRRFARVWGGLAVAGLCGLGGLASVEALRRIGPGAFDARFVAAVTHHHKGAVAMADEAIREAATSGCG